MITYNCYISFIEIQIRLIVSSINHSPLQRDGLIKVQLFLCTPQRHMGEGTNTSTHSQPEEEMEVNGQLHAPAALPPGKQTLHPMNCRMGKSIT